VKRKRRNEMGSRLPEVAVVLRDELDRVLAERDMLRNELRRRRPAAAKRKAPKPEPARHCGLCGSDPCLCGFEAWV
jgi:hypothetical protein